MAELVLGGDAVRAAVLDPDSVAAFDRSGRKLDILGVSSRLFSAQIDICSQDYAERMQFQRDVQQILAERRQARENAATH